jgi:hypothetical protein
MMLALCQAYATVAQTGRLTTDLARLLARQQPGRSGRRHQGADAAGPG